MAHAHNPSYSGGTDQEDHGLMPARENSLTRPYFEKTLHKKMWVGGPLIEWLKV
jgi:hypothetical protein